MNTQTIIKRSTPGFNPLFLDGKQINNVYLYKDGEILGSFKWLSRYGSNNNFPEILIPFEIRAKRKKDLTFKTGFTINESGEYKREFNLYLNADNFNISGYHIMERGGRNHKSFYSVFTVDFICKEETTVKDDSHFSGYGHEISEFKTVSHKISTFIRNEETEHKKKLNNFMQKNNLTEIGGDNVMQVLESAKCASILDSY